MKKVLFISIVASLLFYFNYQICSLLYPQKEISNTVSTVKQLKMVANGYEYLQKEFFLAYGIDSYRCQKVTDYLNYYRKCVSDYYWYQAKQVFYALTQALSWFVCIILLKMMREDSRLKKVCIFMLDIHIALIFSTIIDRAFYDVTVLNEDDLLTIIISFFFSSLMVYGNDFMEWTKKGKI